MCASVSACARATYRRTNLRKHGDVGGELALVAPRFQGPYLIVSSCVPKRKAVRSTPGTVNVVSCIHVVHGWLLAPIQSCTQGSYCNFHRSKLKRVLASQL